MLEKVFIPIPKNGSGTIKYLICRNRLNIHFEARRNRHPRYDQLPPAKKYFTICRNPYDRCVSLYSFLRRRVKRIPPTFDQFVFQLSNTRNLSEIDVIILPQSHWVKRNRNIRLYHFEDIFFNDDHWNKFCVEEFGKILRRRHKNKSNHDDWKTLYNEELYKLVGRLYTMDFRLFGYKRI